MEPYYYSQMNKLEQNVYYAIKNGLLTLAESFPVPKMENRELAEIFFKLRLDCPEIFYVSGFSYRFFKDSSHVIMIPDYLFGKGKIKEQQIAMNARISKLIHPAKAMTEWDKELYIHDFICSRVHYDKLKKPYSHEIIGPLGHGVGVCEGIAKTVKILCDTLGIWCVIAVSDANPEKNIKYRHAWNIVKIGKTYYHLDATFDNSLGHNQKIRYDYFNLGDKQLFRDHEAALYRVPQCKECSQFYYKTKKLSFTKKEDVEKRAVQVMKKGGILTFHWSGGYLTQDTITELLVLLKETAKQKEKHIRMGLNWSQAVLSVEFVLNPSAKEVRIENANEGEVQDQ